MWIYRPYRTDKNGQKIYAKWYGKKAFRFWVDDVDISVKDVDNDDKIKDI